MAVGDIQIGRINRFFVKWLGTKGFSPRTSFGSEIIPVLTLWSGVENRFLDSWARFGNHLGLAAGAGNVNAFRFRNPTGSKVICIIEKVVMIAGVASHFNLTNGPITIDLTNLATTTNSRFDVRGVQTPVAILSSVNAAAPVLLGNFAGAFGQPAQQNVDAIVTENQEIPVGPGDAVQFTSDTVNIANDVSWFWRERSLEDSELQ